MSDTKRTYGPLFVKVSEEYPFNIITTDSNGNELYGGGMSEIKHTTGPWMVGDFRCIYGQLGQVASISTNGTDEERTANAHLISAAPELLEACKAFIAYEESEKESNYIPSMFLYSKAVTKVRAAISKAEGK